MSLPYLVLEDEEVDGYLKSYFKLFLALIEFIYAGLFDPKTNSVLLLYRY